MPVLPGGRHVVVLTSPRFRAWTDLVGKRHVCKFLGLDNPQHMYPWLQVAYVERDKKIDTVANPPRPLPKGSIPYGYHLEDSGYTLDQWSAFTDGWTEKDKAAMKKWMDYELYISLLIAWLGAGQESEEK